MLSSKLEMLAYKSCLNVGQDNAIGMMTQFLCFILFYIQGSFLLVLYSVSKKSLQISENTTYSRGMYYVS